MKLVSLVGLLGTVGASFTYDLMVDMCDSSGCHATQKRVALDANAKPGHENQVHVDGDKLTLDYAQGIGGPRVYFIEQEGVNENTLFELAGKELSFDVELSTMTCGFNAAVYFIGMDKNQGGAESGTHYCDAQAVGGTYCAEMDLFEGNTASNQITTHGCVDECATYSDDQQCKYSQNNNICDHSGCGMNPFRYGPGSSYNGETNNDDYYGRGSQHQIDTSQPFTVTTQFQTDHVERFYTQNGRKIELPTLYVRTPSDGMNYDPFYGPKITDEYCGLTYDKWTGDSGLGPASQMLKNSRNGMVLSMSAWYDQETYPSGGSSTGMSWLDGINNWGHSTKTGPCHTTTSDNGSHGATFSKMKFGDMGTTSPYAPPAPAPAPPPAPAPWVPPAPAPTPSGAAQCCYGGCGTNCNTDWCAESRDNCENNCGGQYCAAPAPPPAPAPGCDCSWVPQYGCGSNDGSSCWGECCGSSGNGCECGWVNQYGCGNNDGSQCWGQCCGGEVSV